MSSSSGDHFRIAWRAYRAHPGVFTGTAFVVFLLWAVLEILVISLHRYGTVLNVLLHLLFLILICGTLLGLYGLALAALAGKSVQLADIVGSLARGPHFLVATILYVVMVAAGLLFLVVPGVHLAVRYALFPQVMASGQAGPIDALRLAGRLAADRWWRVAAVLAQAALVILLGAALLGIGAFVAFPVAVIACSSLYTSLAGIPATGEP